MPVKISKCKCKHEFQDSEYGVGNRVFNMKEKSPGKGKCTVCGTETTFKDGGSDAPAVKKGKK